MLQLLGTIERGVVRCLHGTVVDNVYTTAGSAILWITAAMDGARWTVTLILVMVLVTGQQRKDSRN